MARRGRKPQFRPIPPASPGGEYRIYYPGRGVISLETKDEREAYTKAGVLAQEYEAIPVPVKVETPPVQAPTFSPPAATEVLQQWKTSTPEPVTQSPSLSPIGPSLSPPSQQSLFSPPSQELQSTPKTLTTAEKVNAAMPPEKRQRIAQLIAKGATLINIAGTAACVRMLGRVPALDDNDEAKEVLKDGWEMQLEEWFIEHPPEPWMVIAGGTLAMGIGMYADGTPVPKKDKNPRPPATTIEEAVNS